MRFRQHVIIANEEDVAPQKFTHAKLFQHLPRPTPVESDGNAAKTSESDLPARVAEAADFVEAAARTPAAAIS